MKAKVKVYNDFDSYWENRRRIFGFRDDQADHHLAKQAWEAAKRSFIRQTAKSLYEEEKNESK